MGCAISKRQNSDADMECYFTSQTDEVETNNIAQSSPLSVKKGSQIFCNEINQSQRPEIVLADTQLCTIFPEEIWLTIFEEFCDPITIENTFKASHVFQNIMAPFRVTILFPPVFHILASKYEELLDSTGPKSDDLCALTRRNWCRFSAILPLRLVCQSWWKGVEDFYENLVKENFHVVRQHLDSGHRNVEKQCTIEMTGFRSYDCLERLQNGHGASRNPFLQKRLLLESYETWFFGYNQNLLLKYGTHISYCGLVLYTSPMCDMVQCYAAIDKYTAKMPNLKGLTIEILAPELDSRNAWELKRESEPRLRQQLEQLTFYSIINRRVTNY